MKVNIKTCSKCKEVKLLEEFSKKSESKSGYNPRCKSCVKAVYRINNPLKVKEPTNIKRCTKCDIEKNLIEFNKRKDSSIGYKSHCKTCQALKGKVYNETHTNDIKAYGVAYRDKNKEALKEKSKKYCLDNVEKEKARRKRWKQSNIDRVKSYGHEHYQLNFIHINSRHKRWAKANPEKVNAINSKRRAIKLLAIPAWLTEKDYKAMEAIYAEAKRLEAETGLIYHVDHIHPLQGKLVCGFHCPSNLQILTEAENCSKNNRFTPYVESDLIS